MIDPRYSEDEQAERLKEWWKKNGTSMVLGVVVGVGAIAGVNYWRDYTRSQAEAASDRFAMLVSATDDSGALGSELMEEYAATPYAALAALYLARQKYDAGDAAGAEDMLRWALDNSEQPGIRHPARLRLARLLMERGEVAQAAELAAVDSDDGFASEYQELRGDLALARGDFEAARAAYEEALRQMTPGSAYSSLLAMKLDHATGGAAK